jgi:hypothetical protein
VSYRGATQCVGLLLGTEWLQMNLLIGEAGKLRAKNVELFFIRAPNENANPEKNMFLNVPSAGNVFN